MKNVIETIKGEILFFDEERNEKTCLIGKNEYGYYLYKDLCPLETALQICGMIEAGDRLEAANTIDDAKKEIMKAWMEEDKECPASGLDIKGLCDQIPYELKAHLPAIVSLFKGFEK